MELRYGTAEEAGMSAPRVERLKALARGWVEDGTHPALVVLVARKGVICLHEAYGKLRPGPDSPPLGRDSIFPIMSATKPITAACVLQLVEEGKVGLVRPVREYFPEISGEGTEEVLIHHLLTHLSGWRDSGFAQEATRRGQEISGWPVPEPGQHRSVANFFRLVKGTPLSCRPGEAAEYCQLNYEILGDLVRRVSGVPLEQFARERIFEPLGMCDSSYVLPPEHRERKVRRGAGMPGTENLGLLWPPVDSELSEAIPAGSSGAHTSAHDYAIFAQMLLNGGTYSGKRILSRASVEAMTRNQIPKGVPMRGERAMGAGEFVSFDIPLPGGYGYGLGVFLGGVIPYFNGQLASRSSFSHSGNYGTYWWADPERELVGVLLSVAARLRPGTAFLDLRSDLFVDAVTAAVED